jgi:hypothetical protein
VRLAQSQAGGVAALIHLPFHLLTQTLGETLNGRSQVDDEFYALSRQFARAANQHTGMIGDLAQLPVLPEPEPSPDGAVWFQPSEDRKTEPAEPEPQAPADPLSQPFSQSQSQYRPRAPIPPQHHARPAPPPPPVQAAAPVEPTPIFEAIESEWVRRREQARAAAAASRRAPEPQGSQHSRQAQQLPQPFPDPVRNQAAQTLPDAPASAPAPVSAPLSTEAAEPADWSSPADEGWRAARALTNPAQDGVTRSGLPRRTPRANLVPGRAGGTGAARAVPPQNLRRDSSPGGRP